MWVKKCALGVELVSASTASACVFFQLKLVQVPCIHQFNKLKLVPKSLAFINLQRRQPETLKSYALTYKETLSPNKQRPGFDIDEFLADVSQFDVLCVCAHTHTRTYTHTHIHIRLRATAYV